MQIKLFVNVFIHLYYAHKYCEIESNDVIELSVF